MAIIKSFDNNTKTLTMEFTTISSLVEYLKETPTNECFTDQHLSSQITDEWKSKACKTESFEESMNFLEFGWTAESEKLSQKLNIAKLNAPTISRRKTYQSVVGYAPIVSNYLMGIPTNMLDSKFTQIKQKVVTLNKDISYHAGYTAERIEDNSVKAFQIVQALEAQGIRCNLNVIDGCIWRNAKNVKRFIVKIRVKNSNEKLNISKTSYPLVNPSMLRRTMFRITETIPELKKEDYSVRIGYGEPYDSYDLKSYVEKQKEYFLARDIKDVKEEANTFIKTHN